MVRGKPHTLRQRHRLFLIIPSTIKPIPPSSPSFSRKQEQAHQLLFRLPITHALRQPENVANPATSNVLLNTPFSDEPSPLHFRFQAASVYQTVSIGSLKPTPAAQYAQSPPWRNVNQNSRLPAYLRRSPRRISLVAHSFCLRLSGCLVAHRRLGRFAAA